MEFFLLAHCSKSDGDVNSSIELFNSLEEAVEPYKVLVKDALDSFGIDFAIELYRLPSIEGLDINFDEDTVIDLVTKAGDEELVHQWNTNGEQEALGVVGDSEDEEDEEDKQE